MSRQLPFALTIFVADGDPDGLRLVSRTNWIGQAVIFPRALYTLVRERSEFQQTGVYLLLGPGPDGDGEMLYIGEGDPIRPRLDSHYAKKDFWTRSVFFFGLGNYLNKAHVQYLEARLVSLASLAKRISLENGNKPTEPTLSEADRANIDVFLQNILGMLPVLGIHAFEQSPSMTKRDETNILTCKGGGITATGFETPQGFVVREGSCASKTEVPSIKQERFAYIGNLRAELLKKGVLHDEEKMLRFTQDYTFNSPSLASSLLLGRSSNGRTEWKDRTGKTLKQLQEAQAAS